MSVPSCIAAGLAKVLRAPSFIIWLYLAGVLLAIPLTAALRGALVESFGTSLVQRNLEEGFDLDWYGEFAQAKPQAAKTFGPGVIGFLPAVTNLESLMDGTLLKSDPAVVAAGILYLLAWAFLLGGIIAEYGDGGESGLRQGFFQMSAGYFFRFARLLPLSVLFYWAVFRWLAGPLHSFAAPGSDGFRPATKIAGRVADGGIFKEWWRWRESNPRPRAFSEQSLHAYPIRSVSPARRSNRQVRHAASSLGFGSDPGARILA